MRDYGKARQAAQALADETGQLVRLRRVREYGRRGYRWNLVPRPDRQFGRDMEGELLEPKGPPKCAICGSRSWACCGERWRG